MKKISRRDFLKVAGISAAAMGLAACGGSSSSTAASTAASTAEPQDVSLVMWGAEEDQSMLKDMVEAFKAEHADEVNLNITIGVQSESSAKDTVLTDPTAAADVFAFADDQINDLVAASALQPIADIGDRLSLADVRSRNASGSVDAATVNDTLYAFPLTASNGYFMFYDASVFTEDDVKTMDRMLEVAGAAGKQITMQLNSGWYLYSFFAGAGLSLSLNEDGSNACNWNEAPGTDVVQAILDICSNPAFVSLQDADFVAGVQDGSLVAGVNGTWNATVAEEAWGENYAATKLPTYTLNGEQVQMCSFSGFKLLGVNPHSANVGWAMLLADYISNEENQAKRFELRGEGPANLNAAASEAVQAAPAIAALAEQAAYSTPQRVGGNYWTPTETLGDILAAGNPDGTDLQALLDTCVEGITAPVA